MPRTTQKSLPNYKDFTFKGTAVWEAVEEMALRDRECSFQKGVDSIQNKIEYALVQIALDIPKAMKGKSQAEIAAYRSGAVETIKAIRTVLTS